MKKLTLIVLLTIFTLILLPRELMIGDTSLHIPFIKFYQSHDMYKNDYLRQLGQSQSKLSLYYPLMSWITGFTKISLFNTFKILHIIYLVSFFTIILNFTELFTGNLLIGTVSSLILISRFHIGGASITPIETEFVPRGISLVLGLWGIYFWSLNKKKFLYIFLFISFLIHALTVFYFLLLIASYYFFIFLNNYKFFKNSAFIYLILIIFINLILLIPLKFIGTDKHWINILINRNSYAFLSVWNVKSWINLFLVLVPGLIYFLIKFKFKSNKLNKFIFFVYLMVLVITLSTIFLTAVSFSPYLILLQIGRFWLFPVLLSVMAFSHLLIINTPKKYLKFLILIFIVIAILSNYRGNVRGDELLSNSWYETQDWVKNNTNQNCVFLVPFNSNGFRIGSDRAITGDYKDGTLSFYSKNFAYEWEKRYIDLKDWEKLSDMNILKLQNIYKFNYIIQKNTTNRSFKLSYQNNGYIIYDLTKYVTCSK